MNLLRVVIRHQLIQLWQPSIANRSGGKFTGDFGRRFQCFGDLTMNIGVTHQRRE